MMNRIRRRHIVLLALLSVLATVAIFYLRNDQNGKSYILREYDDKDFQAIVNLVNANKYWLSETLDFSPERMLLTKAPSHEPNRKGIVKIEVAEVDGVMAGFISYYRKSAENGYIWVLAVDQTFRGRGIGEGLVTHAINYFKNNGARYVTLNARINNKPARSLYQKLGFTEQSRAEDRGMIMLIKRNL